MQKGKQQKHEELRLNPVKHQAVGPALPAAGLLPPISQYRVGMPSSLPMAPPGNDLNDGVIYRASTTTSELEKKIKKKSSLLLTQ